MGEEPMVWILTFRQHRRQTLCNKNTGLCSQEQAKRPCQGAKRRQTLIALTVKPAVGNCLATADPVRSAETMQLSPILASISAWVVLYPGLAPAGDGASRPGWASALSELGPTSHPCEPRPWLYRRLVTLEPDNPAPTSSIPVVLYPSPVGSRRGRVVAESSYIFIPTAAHLSHSPTGVDLPTITVPASQQRKGQT